MGSIQSKLRSLRCTKRTPSPTQAPPRLALTQTQAPPRQAPPRRISGLMFRVLVIGRANAGKTSILQRVCDTTESPKIYRRGREVCSTNFVHKSDLTDDQVKLNPSMDVSDTSIPLHLPLNTVSARRAHHRR